MGALKRTTEDYAEQIASYQYGRYLGELTPEQQREVWERAGERVQQELERRLEMEADKYCPKCGVLFAIHEGDGSCPVADDELRKCPKCGESLEHFSGLEHIPEYLYCPKCNDTAYAEDGSVIRLE